MSIGMTAKAAAVVGSVVVLAAVVGCDSGLADFSESAPAHPVPQGESWVRIEGVWPHRVALSDAGRVGCFSHPGMGGGNGWREFTASTSDFAEYDGGGDVAEKQVAVEIHIGDQPPHGVIVNYIGPDGAHFRLAVSPAEVTLNDDGTAARFVISGVAESVDAEPVSVAMEGQVHCSSVAERP